MRRRRRAVRSGATFAEELVEHRCGRDAASTKACSLFPRFHWPHRRLARCDWPIRKSASLLRQEWASSRSVITTCCCWARPSSPPSSPGTPFEHSRCILTMLLARRRGSESAFCISIARRSTAARMRHGRCVSCSRSPTRLARCRASALKASVSSGMLTMMLAKVRLLCHEPRHLIYHVAVLSEARKYSLDLLPILVRFMTAIPLFLSMTPVAFARRRRPPLDQLECRPLCRL